MFSSEEDSEEGLRDEEARTQGHQQAAPVDVAQDLMIRKISGPTLTNLNLDEPEPNAATELDRPQQLNLIPAQTAGTRLAFELHSDTGGSSVEELPQSGCRSVLSTALQIIPSLLFAGIGMVCAGLLLGRVEHWPPFIAVPEIFILVPPLLGLKGNLEMTLASRLSRASNLGLLDSSDSSARIISSNLAVVVVQAIVVANVASAVALVSGEVTTHDVTAFKALLLFASAGTTAFVAGALNAVCLAGVVVLCRKCDMDPDNVAIPVGAALGDLITLAVLAMSSSVFLPLPLWALMLVSLTLAASIPIWVAAARKDAETFLVLRNGWGALFAAMTISTAGGLVLEGQVTVHESLAALAPIMNGVGGNLASVHASHLCTDLARLKKRRAVSSQDTVNLLSKATNRSDAAESNSVEQEPVEMNVLTQDEEEHEEDTSSQFLAYQKAKQRRIFWLLFLLVIPTHLLLLFALEIFGAARHDLSSRGFLAAYLVSASLQVLMLLLLAQLFVSCSSRRGWDPVNIAIPFLTSLGDLIGIGFLALSYSLMEKFA